MGMASGLFNGDRPETLIKRISPSSEQREFLQTQWNLLATNLKDRLYKKYGYKISTWLQGSYKYGTLIKPIGKNESYDVDLGIYFEWTNENPEPSASQLRIWVQQELVNISQSDQAIRKIAEPPKERCSRTIFHHQFHIDTPVYHLNNEKDQRRLACLEDKWESSDPKKMYKWFKNAVNDADKEQLRRVVKYIKAWAAVSFIEAPKSRPTSIFLTVLITEGYKSLWASRLLGLSDDDACIAIIEYMHRRLFKNSEVLNPADVHKKENLNRMTSDDWNGFKPRLATLKDIAERANEAQDEPTAAIIWSEAFSFLMPLSEVEQVEIFDEKSGSALMNLPDISIQVYSRRPAKLVTQHKNQIPHVPKNCDLVFSIINPQLIPDYATIEWTVRNEGSEADAVSDLGHRKIGVKLFKVKEKTAYSGRHFMDCTIRSNGQLIGLRRVPINISALEVVPRNLPRPAYTKFRSKSRR